MSDETIDHAQAPEYEEYDEQAAVENAGKRLRFATGLALCLLLAACGGTIFSLITLLRPGPGDVYVRQEKVHCCAPGPLSYNLDFDETKDVAHFGSGYVPSFVTPSIIAVLVVLFVPLIWWGAGAKRAGGEVGVGFGGGVPNRMVYGIWALFVPTYRGVRDLAHDLGSTLAGRLAMPWAIVWFFQLFMNLAAPGGFVRLVFGRSTVSSAGDLASARHLAEIISSLALLAALLMIGIVLGLDSRLRHYLTAEPETPE